MRDWKSEAYRYAPSSRADELEARDETPCPKCSGSGYTLYGSTATWRGGVGGQTMTTDVCDKCWGSGCAERPWPSHRRRQVSD